MEKYIHGLFPIWGIRFIAVADNADTEAAEVVRQIFQWSLEGHGEQEIAHKYNQK